MRRSPWGVTWTVRYPRSVEELDPELPACKSTGCPPPKAEHLLARRCIRACGGGPKSIGFRIVVELKAALAAVFQQSKAIATYLAHQNNAPDLTVYVTLVATK